MNKSKNSKGSKNQKPDNDIESWWHNSLDAVPEMISIQDSSFRLVRVNKAYAKTVGMSKKALIGKKCFEVRHGKMKPIANCPYVHTLSTKRTKTVEHFEPIIGKHLATSSSPVFDKKRRLLGVIHVSKDITKRKLLENELKEIKSGLEKKVRERTRRLQEVNRQLRKEIEDHQAMEIERSNLYKHIGITNRKISILSDLNGQEDGVKNIDEKIKKIVILASEISNSDVCMLFGFNGKSKDFELLKSQVGKKVKSKKKVFSVSSCELFDDFAKRKRGFETDLDRFGTNVLKLKPKFKRVVMLPLMSGNSMKWSLLLGFESGEVISNVDLGLYEAFSTQAAIFLNKSK